jgi:hypothetical protein
MSTTDAPDWERIVTLETGATVTDAPDWTRVVTGPGGTQPVISAGPSFMALYVTGNFLGITSDPACSQSNEIMATNRLNLVAFTAVKTATATNVWAFVQGGATGTTDENFLCIYDFGQTTAGEFTLLGSTAAGTLDTPFKSTGIKTMALSSGVSLTAGETYAVGFIFNGGQPTLYGASAGASIVNNPLGLTVAPWRCETNTGVTTPPTSELFSAVITTAQNPLFMVS